MGDGLDFGEALILLKAGKNVSRKGWNGKGMFLYLEKAALGSDGEIFQPFIVMYTAQQQYQPGWLASQADMLANDWEETVFPMS